MPGISVTVSAEVVDLVTKFTVAKAASSGLSSELNKLGKEGAANGLDSVKDRLTKVATESIAATAKTKQLAAEMKALQPAATHASASLSDLAGAAGQLGVAFSVATLVGLGKAALDYAADIQHTADVLGLTTDQVQAWNYAARQSGVSTEDADTLLRRFMNSMGGVQENTGPAVEAVKDLGLTADELAGDPWAALQKIVVALDKIPDPARKAHDEVQIFSRAGMDLNAMLPLLAQNFDTLRQKASDAGQLMDPGLTKAAEDAQNTIRSLTAEMEGADARALVYFGGLIKDVTSNVYDAIMAFAKWDMQLAGLKVPAAPDDKSWLKSHQAGFPAPTYEPPKQIPMPDAGAPPKIDISSKKTGAAAVYGVDPDMMEQVKAEMAELRQMDQSDADTSVRVAQLAFDQKRQILGEEVAAGKITKQQELADLIQTAEQEKAVKLKALSDEIANNSTDLPLTNSLENQKKVIVAQTETEIAALRRQIEQDSANDSAEIWKRSLAEIGSAEDTFVSKMMGGRVTLTGALVASAQQLVEKEIEADLKGLTAHILLNQQKLAADKAAGQMGVIWDELFGQQKVATAGGTATEVNTIKASAAAAGLATQKAVDAAGATADAVRAAQGAYAAVAGVPYIGPILAPVAAAAAFAAVEAFGSFEVGTNSVPRDMPAFVHAGERIIPAADNRALMAALSVGGAGGARANNINIGPFNNNGGREWNAEDHARDIVRVLKNQVRLGHLR